jgi:UDP-N-acetylmuramate--alanine ligase
MVIEADEYDRAFLKLTPTIAVVNSLESEHMDTYGTMEELRNCFVEFANKVPFYGKVICCVDWPEVRKLIPRLNRRYTTFGIEEPADVMAENIVLDHQLTSFSVRAFGNLYQDVRLNVPGRHNVLNGLAAFSVGIELGLPVERIIAGLAKYSGMRRRFQVKFEGGGALVIDDYAHHPSEVKAAVRAAREGWTSHKITAVFQPHLFSRTREFADEFGWSLSRADMVYVADVYPSRERVEDHPGVTGELVAEATRKAGCRQVSFVPDREQLFSELQGLAGDGNLILFMGAGDITNLASRVAGHFRSRT